MRVFRFFAFISLGAAGLSGCGPEDSGSTTFNPATDVDVTFSTFNLENTSQAPDNLAQTRFQDFYRGLQPNTDSRDSDRATAAEIRSHIAIFIGATDTVGSNTDGAYTQVRNPLDLMNQVIASGEVANFVDGRGYIRQRIGEGAAGTYNSRENNSDIRFTDQTAVLADTPLNDHTWIYPTLDWRYLPAGTGDSVLSEKVYRSIQYVSRSVGSEEQAAQPELISVLAGTRFDANQFVTQGYNNPEYATADYLSRSFGSIELRQDFIDARTDTLFIKSRDQQVLDLSRYDESQPADASPDCLRIELDYSLQVLRIFSSDGEPATVTNEDSPTSEKNPDYCGNQANEDAVASWQVIATPGRQ